MKEEKYIIGQRIKETIVSSGKTQKEYAKLLGISENSLTNYVNGKRIPDALLIAKICLISKIPPAWILNIDKSLNNSGVNTNDSSINEMELLIKIKQLGLLPLLNEFINEKIKLNELFKKLLQFE